MDFFAKLSVELAFFDHCASVGEMATMISGDVDLLKLIEEARINTFLLLLQMVPHDIDDVSVICREGILIGAVVSYLHLMQRTSFDLPELDHEVQAFDVSAVVIVMIYKIPSNKAFANLHLIPDFVSVGSGCLHVLLVSQELIVFVLCLFKLDPLAVRVSRARRISHNE